VLLLLIVVNVFVGMIVFGTFFWSHGGVAGNEVSVVQGEDRTAKMQAEVEQIRTTINGVIDKVRASQFTADQAIAALRAQMQLTPEEEQQLQQAGQGQVVPLMQPPQPAVVPVPRLAWTPPPPPPPQPVPTAIVTNLPPLPPPPPPPPLLPPPPPVVGGGGLSGFVVPGYVDPEGGKIWLAVGMASVTRRKTYPSGELVDYLTRTMDTLAADLPGSPDDPLVGQLEVHIMNNQPQGHPKGPHPIWQQNKQRFASHPKQHFFKFVDNPGTLKDPNPTSPTNPDPDDNNNPTNRPGQFVRQQTIDVVQMIRLVAPRSKYFMFMEDDFETCHNAIPAIQYVIDKANGYEPNWLALRVSYGMNGIIIKSTDALDFANYLWQHLARVPPDLLYREYRESHPGRPLMAYRFNLFNHIGTHSSLPRPDRPPFPQCHEGLDQVWSLSHDESFDIGMCPADDISPCARSSGNRGMVAPVDWRRNCQAGPPKPRQHLR